MARGRCPVPALADRTELITGGEDTAKRGQALPLPLLLGFDLHLLVPSKDNGSKN